MLWVNSLLFEPLSFLIRLFNGISKFFFVFQPFLIINIFLQRKLLSILALIILYFFLSLLFSKIFLLIGHLFVYAMIAKEDMSFILIKLSILLSRLFRLFRGFLLGGQTFFTLCIIEIFHQILIYLRLFLFFFCNLLRFWSFLNLFDFLGSLRFQVPSIIMSVIRL